MEQRGGATAIMVGSAMVPSGHVRAADLMASASRPQAAPKRTPPQATTSLHSRTFYCGAPTAFVRVDLPAFSVRALRPFRRQRIMKPKGRLM